MTANDASEPALIAAIGDVHGRDDLLATMLAELEALARAEARTLVVYFLGDIVDRGPASAAALDRVAATLDRHPGSRLFLGNHDDWLLALLDNGLDAGSFEHWLGQGGAETLSSYGCDAWADAAVATRHLLAERPDHHRLLAQASLMGQRAGHLFVHAGIDPGRPLDRQDRHDLLWIRAPFSEHVGALPAIVVHGHQPQPGGLPVVTENRISLDTGAVFTGSLTALVLDEDNGGYRFFATTETGIEAIEPVRLDRGFGTVLENRGAGPA